ncbi:hypothetical protein Wcon_01242 [Wolbachia endosymbiont of Cylisticus convexus]|uniref:hypothetical protein n=1 Tax=Wolbachia endosymbiont of Cylisticus convexus TaxID=118728 RepID=UPI000DF71582|nr:hypothetical protein [Wolbachia endosymbiont of Cylisticus convexus]RDD34662.1 hypothetical protein Wcon_01242 [Wolbachia endosymbiont of Cylisticus convexus]
MLGNQKNSEVVNPVSFCKEAYASKHEDIEVFEKFIVIDNQEEWEKFFKAQNDISTNTTNKVIQKPHVHKNSEGMYRYTAEGNKYNGKEIIGKVAEQIKEEIAKNVKSSVIKLKESKNADNSVKPVLRIVLDDNTKEVNLMDLISNDVCKKYGVKTITLCLPDKSHTRGIRCQIDEHGARIYEVANGSYDMTLNWYVEGKECRMKINISDDGSVKFIERNGVTWDQLAAYQEVKVGRQYEAKPLYEALSHLRQEGSEIVEASHQPSASVESVVVSKQLSLLLKDK